MNKYKAIGTILYSDNGWVIIKASDTITNYYKWWVSRLTWKPCSTPYHGSHITVINGNFVDKNIVKHPRWGKYHKKRIEFTYSNKITFCKQADGIYYWLPVECPLIYNLRSELGLPPQLKWDLHLTVAYRQH